ncbi:hypothetical protein BTM25_18080 [Actinomadura rubteroloni]|uniref:Mce-associated membrane protein n=1 Tax=Actinomadura rubteroloni TaxID=1926885 RepID=A0A2P4UQU0_9ACTN|nr:hypothetical protein [Actinomadura rubteroloni]POM27394.1 hypothetical protein BTM25_18080 [Actinomadura rubteroloni]
MAKTRAQQPPETDPPVDDTSGDGPGTVADDAAPARRGAAKAPSSDAREAEPAEDAEAAPDDATGPREGSKPVGATDERPVASGADEPAAAKDAVDGETSADRPATAKDDAPAAAKSLSPAGKADEPAAESSDASDDADEPADAEVEDGPDGAKRRPAGDAEELAASKSERTAKSERAGRAGKAAAAETGDAEDDASDTDEDGDAEDGDEGRPAKDAEESAAAKSEPKAKTGGAAKAAAGKKPVRTRQGARTAGGGRAEQEGGTWSDPLARTALVLVAVAVVFAAWAGQSWYSAAHDDGLKFSKLREQVRQAGEQDVQNLSTLDYRDVAKGLASWRDSSTGDLHDQLVQGGAELEKSVREAQSATTATVLQSGVTELDDRAGRAFMILALRITATQGNGQPTVKQTRMTARLERTPSGWKVSGLVKATEGTSGS